MSTNTLEDGLISFEYNFVEQWLDAVYEPDSYPDFRKLIGYAEEISDGKCRRVTIYEGNTLLHDFRASKTAGWTDIAKQAGR